jgi:hypothetical protein
MGEPPCATVASGRGLLRVFVQSTAKTLLLVTRDGSPNWMTVVEFAAASVSQEGALLDKPKVAPEE